MYMIPSDIQELSSKLLEEIIQSDDLELIKYKEEAYSNRKPGLRFTVISGSSTYTFNYRLRLSVENYQKMAEIIDQWNTRR